MAAAKAFSIGKATRSKIQNEKWGYNINIGDIN